jgi:Fic family protein
VSSAVSKGKAAATAKLPPVSAPVAAPAAPAPAPGKTKLAKGSGAIPLGVEKRPLGMPSASKLLPPKLPREARALGPKRILPLKRDRSGGDPSVSKGLPRVSRPPGSTLPTLPPQATRPRPRTLEDRLTSLRELQAKASPEQRADLQYRLDVSWIHHDSAIEGMVYEPSELVSTLARMQAAQPGDPPIVFTPLQEEIRQHKLAIDLVRDMATRKKEPITLETLRLLYATLAPDDDEPKGVLKYRKDMPLHRVYFHEISTPDKIPGLMRQLVQWLDSEETRRTMHPTRIASRAHYKLLRIFPFTKHSGKVARLLMNLLLLREGYPPVILHATDRQRYYDAVKVSSDATAKVVNDALENGVESELRYWHRAFGIEETP